MWLLFLLLNTQTQSPHRVISEWLGTTTKNPLGCYKANLFFLPSPCKLRGNVVWPEVGQSSSFFSRFNLIVGANREEGVNIPPQNVLAGSAYFVKKKLPERSPAPTRLPGGAVPDSRTRRSAPGVGWRGGCSATGNRGARPGPR